MSSDPISPQEIKKLIQIQKTLEEMNLSAIEAQQLFEEIQRQKPDGITIEGVRFPEGTAFLNWYKGNIYVCRVKNGLIVNDNFPDEPETALSGAAAQITGREHTNGQDWWTLVVYPNRKQIIPFRKIVPKKK